MQPLPDPVRFRHLARVVESSDDAIISKDLSGIITSWNQAAEVMFGYAANEAVGQSIRMIIPADRQAEEEMVLERIRAGQPISHFETIRQRKDGTLIPISLSVSPILDDTGRVIGASKIARDISEQVAAGIASRRLAAVVESTDDAIITKDLEGVITAWNAAAERIFGYTAAEAIGRSIRMLIPAELQGEEDLVLGKIRAGEKLDHYETVRMRKDGRRISISLTVSPLRNERGEVIGASKIARDISERSRLLAVANEHAANSQKLGEVGAVVASTLDREEIVQKVTDIARDLTRAEFGAFFYMTRAAASRKMRITSGLLQECMGCRMASTKAAPASASTKPAPAPIPASPQLKPPACAAGRDGGGAGAVAEVVPARLDVGIRSVGRQFSPVAAFLL